MIDRDATKDKGDSLAEGVGVHTEPHPQSVHSFSVSA